MTLNEIKGKIEEYKGKYEQKTLKVNPSFAPTTPKVLELVECFANSRYRDGDYDDTGWRKYFYNISDTPWITTVKSIDVDTKNFQVINEDHQSYTGSYILGRDLKFWMKTQGFNALLNEGVEDLPKYGHLVWKKIGDKIFNVPLRNLYYDPESKSILKSPVLIERHQMLPSELKKMPWDKEKVKSIIASYKKAKEPKAEVFEIYVDGEGLSIVSGLDIRTPEILYTSDDTIEDRYKECIFERVRGRANGRGVIEKLFESQIMQNESVCYLMRGLKWSTLHLWQSRDENVKKNFLLDSKDGDILTALSEINPISTEERNLGAFRYIDSLISNSSQSRTFTQDITRGDRPPAGTPLGTTQLQAAMSGGFFDFKRENFSIFLKDVIDNWVLPSFKKQNKKAKKIHLTKLLGEAAGDKIFNMIVDGRTRTRQLESAQRGKLIGGQELEMLQATIAETVKESDMSLPESFCEDLNYKVDVVITGEQIDLSSRISTAQVFLQMIGSNPTIMQDPNTKRIVQKIMDWAGLPLETFWSEETPTMQNIVAQRGGSLPAAPTPNVQPQMVNQTV